MKKLLFLSCVLFKTVIFAQNIGINPTGISADPSAILDVNATDKGILIPRVSLNSYSDALSIPNPATSLLIYNTNAALGEGFYYNDNTAVAPHWSKIVKVSEVGRLDEGNLNDGTNLTNGLTLGYGSGEGIASQRTAVGGSSQYGLDFYTAFSNRMHINANGNVGIGTTAVPTERLQLNGNLRLQGAFMPNNTPGASGSVLVSQGAGTPPQWQGPVAFRAEAIANQSIALYDSALILFPNVEYNYGLGYYPALSAFEAPVAGVYHFSLNLNGVESTVLADAYVRIKKNGVTYKSFLFAETNNLTTASISTDLALDLHDVITFEFATTTSTMHLLASPISKVYPNISGHLIR